MSEPSLMPLVSVIIPTFNRAHMIGDALASVLQQTYKNIEVLVIDDGSTDNTQAVIANLNASCVRYIKQKNAGASAARNFGITLSKADYVAFLDSDDIYESKCIEAKVAIAMADENCVLVGGGCSYFDEHSKSCIADTPARSLISYEDLCIFTAFPGATSNIFAKRAAIIAAGPFVTSLSNSEDRDFLRRLVKQGNVKSCNFNTVSMRIHSGFRPNRDKQKQYADREWISAQIPEKNLRQRSRAWNAMVMANMYWSENQKLSAIAWWIRSFLIYPGSVHPERPRLKSILRNYSPNSYYPETVTSLNTK